MVFDTSAKYKALAKLLGESRWFDPQWMSFSPREGYPATGSFGLLSGPAYRSGAFYHDLAHAMIAVQDDQAWRLDRYGFALNYTTTVEVFGRHYDQPVTDQGVQLELRVIALQYRLMTLDRIFDRLPDAEGEEEFFKFNVGSLRYMEDFLNTKVAFREQGLTRRCKPYTEEERQVIAILIEWCKRMARAIPEQHIASLWERTCVAGRAALAEEASASAA